MAERVLAGSVPAPVHQPTVRDAEQPGTAYNVIKNTRKWCDFEFSLFSSLTLFLQETEPLALKELMVLRATCRKASLPSLTLGGDADEASTGVSPLELPAFCSSGSLQSRVRGVLSEEATAVEVETLQSQHNARAEATVQCVSRKEGG